MSSLWRSFFLFLTRSMLNSVCLDRLRQEDLKWALEISTLHLLLFFKLELALSKFKNENFNLYT